MTFSLNRKKGQTIRIIDRYAKYEVCTIDIADIINGHTVKVGIDATQQYLIVRGEQNVEEKEKSAPPIDRKEPEGVGYFDDYDDYDY